MIFDFVTKGFGSVKDAFSGAFSSVKDAATSTWNSALKPIGQAGYNMVQKNLSRLDNLGNTADKLVGGVGNAADGLGNLLAGNSNILVYLGIGALALVVVPKLIDKVL